MQVSRRFLALAATAALAFGACSNAATSAPSSQPAASQPAASQAAASTVPSVAPTQVATVPGAQLVTAGKLTVCSDIPYPPQEFFDESGNPTGSDIDIATEIGKRLGLGIA